MGDRAHIPLKQQLAAALRDMAVEEDGKLVRAIPYEVAKQMTADQIISLFNCDHGILHALKRIDEHWNLTFRFIPAHRLKTAKQDVPALAKGDRIAEEHEAFRRRMLAKAGQGEPAENGESQAVRKRSKMHGRPFPTGRKLQSGPGSKLKGRQFPKSDRVRVPRFKVEG